MPSLSHNIESQAHSRVPECDGRPTFQVESGPVDGMVTTSTGVQPDMPTVVHSQRGPVYHSSEPQASTVRVNYPRLNINCTGLTAYPSPPTALLHKVIQKSGNAIAQS